MERPMTAPAPIVVICTLRRDSGAAVLVADSGNPELEAWLPRSQVLIENGMFGRLRITMPAWLAKEKGFLGGPAPGQGRLL
jgi:hypothetical protein